MLVFDPDERISVEEALQHPYLSELHGQVPTHIFSVSPLLSWHLSATLSDSRADGGAPLQERLRF